MVKVDDLCVDVDVVDVGKENDNKAFGNSDLTLIRELDFHYFPTLYLVCVWCQLRKRFFRFTKSVPDLRRLVDTLSTLIKMAFKVNFLSRLVC